jgi:glycosyltransferase involved in cell wall biosynthesis
MISQITLSYVLTTYNKLKYLKLVIDDLISNCKYDEEIIVTDGGSTDGTKEFLESLYKDGKIHQFISEKDFGESHGFNKGILMAKGEIIKLITDDDVFCYEVIKNCKEYMLKNEKVEILNTNGGWASESNLTITEFTSIYEDFCKNNWLKNNHPFAHCALGIMFRRNCISKIGLFSVGITRSDAEFTLRFTSLNINFCWYTGNSYVRILNKDSNSNLFKVKIANETERLNAFYGFDIDKIYTENTDDLKIETRFNFLMQNIKRKVKSFFLHTHKTIYSTPTIEQELNNFEILYHNSLIWMSNVNIGENKFIVNEKYN